MRGEFWWDGSAVWFSVANYEYQSLDATWLGFSPILIAVMTHLTVFWETFYAVLVWPKLTRPVVLAMALIVHGGICLFLGMITFGTAMIIANVAFVDPRTIDGSSNGRGVELAWLSGRRLSGRRLSGRRLSEQCRAGELLRPWPVLPRQVPS